MKGENIKITCKVDTYPAVETFHWSIGNQSNAFHGFQTNNDTTSTISISAKEKHKRVFCWASNSVGRQSEPCMFKVMQAGE